MFPAGRAAQSSPFPAWVHGSVWVSRMRLRDPCFLQLFLWLLGTGWKPPALGCWEAEGLFIHPRSLEERAELQRLSLCTKGNSWRGSAIPQCHDPFLPRSSFPTFPSFHTNLQQMFWCTWCWEVKENPNPLVWVGLELLCPEVWICCPVPAVV